ncbi:MAG TPA: RNA polymerase sigma factor, partial [Planctomycetota bacterium]|nr:RNA polymerase sigma factor [Planctomycetota bacterium]
MLTPEAFAQELEAQRGVFLTLAAAILGRRSEAEDVLQDASAVALGKLASFEVGTNFGAWMGQIVRYVALNHVRRRTGRDSMPADSIDERCFASAGVDEPADARLLGELSRDQDHFDDEVLAALLSLSPTARACLLLRAVQDLDYSELSRLLGSPEGTAMSHVHRARAALRAALLARQSRGE